MPCGWNSLEQENYLSTFRRPVLAVAGADSLQDLQFGRLCKTEQLPAGVGDQGFGHHAQIAQGIQELS
ncbi:hypothetical protein RPPX_28455 (plasmid) [Pseudomonas putida S12]|uniref:Uncharacterized protein n=1 Tax=Pseudomonas putida S12 TaxID=1215087 RepID=A0AA34WUT6_PSEPU|nr:hypothetical protein RPPX_28455 [Pseudomonas putida S12]